MTTLLSIQDLNTTVNHEPRLQDVILGKYLGLSRARDVRTTIEKNRDELELHGSLAVTNRKSRGQEYSEYYLNEAQCLLLCMFSRTEKAAYVRKSIIDVFMDYRRGNEHGSPEHKERVVKVLNDMMAHTVYLQRQLADTYDVMREVDVHSMNAIAARWMAERMQGEIHGVIEGLGEIANVLFKFSRACSKKPRVK